MRLHFESASQIILHTFADSLLTRVRSVLDRRQIVNLILKLWVNEAARGRHVRLTAAHALLDVVGVPRVEHPVVLLICLFAQELALSIAHFCGTRM